eukprot:scaffold3124_cov390-Prasinococcus_capsulatus_cf.AAC.2
MSIQRCARRPPKLWGVLGRLELRPVGGQRAQMVRLPTDVPWRIARAPLRWSLLHPAPQTPAAQCASGRPHRRPRAAAAPGSLRAVLRSPRTHWRCDEGNRAGHVDSERGASAEQRTGVPDWWVRGSWCHVWDVVQAWLRPGGGGRRQHAARSTAPPTAPGDVAAQGDTASGLRCRDAGVARARHVCPARCELSVAGSVASKGRRTHMRPRNWAPMWYVAAQTDR